jgi:hypothetical protein
MDQLWMIINQKIERWCQLKSRISKIIMNMSNMFYKIMGQVKMTNYNRISYLTPI